MSDSIIADEVFCRITKARMEGYANGHIDGIKEGRIMESIENSRQAEEDRGSVFVLGIIFGGGVGIVMFAALDWLLG